MFHRALKLAFPNTLPVMAGYLFLGLGFGVLLSQAGYGAFWALMMSGGIYAGAMQFVTIDLLLTGAGLVQAALMTLLVNARHLVYGLTMASRYQNTGGAKPYLAFALTDETFALLATFPVPEGLEAKQYYTAVSALNQAYWVVGSLLGSLLGQVLPFDLSGIEFSMTALFVVMLVEQWRNKAARPSMLVGVLSALLCRILFGENNFTLPAMALICLALLLGRKQLGTQEGAA